MVDALCEAWRVLAGRGRLVDLRPVWTPAGALEVVTSEGPSAVGVVDPSAACSGDEAADDAVARVVGSGLYRPLGQTRISFELTWRTVGEMAAYLSAARRPRVTPSYAELEEALERRRRAAGGTARLRFWRRMKLVVYRKAPGSRPPTS